MSEKEQNNLIEQPAEVTSPDVTQIGTDPIAVAVEGVQPPAAPQAETESLADRVRIISPFKLVMKRFFRSRLSVVGLSMFIFVILFSFLGPLFVPWSESIPDESPAVRITYNNNEYTATDPEGNKYTYYTISFSQESHLNKHAPAGTYGINEKGERALHLFGTDGSGYDILVRLMYGGRLSLTLSFMVVLVYTVIGIILGGISGYFGGWVDMVIMRIVDVLNCIPSLPLMLIIGAIFDNAREQFGLDPNLKLYIMLFVLTLLSWPGTARLVRGQILTLREQEYMVAADALGLGAGRKIFKHLVPNVMPQLIVSMTLGLGGTILTEASLSFLGLGAPPAVASLGQMVSLASSSNDVLYYYPFDWLPAGIIIIVSVVAFNFIGDGLRDALDPKMKR